MPIIEEINSECCEEVKTAEVVTVSQRPEQLEIQSESINLCFVGKPETEPGDECLVSDTSSASATDGGVRIFSKRSPMQLHSQCKMPVIEEIELQDVEDSGIPSDNNVHGSAQLAKKGGDSVNGVVGKFYANLLTFLSMAACCTMFIGRADPLGS